MAEISVPWDELRKRKLFVATPMYGGMCYGTYTKSTNDLAMFCVKQNIELRFFYLFNESLITRARNYIADEFMRSGFTHLMFIDSDISFDVESVISLLAISEPQSDKEIVCGPYSKKTIAWEKIVMAVNKGYGDGNPNDLQKYIGDYVFNPVEGTKEIPIGEPVEVLESGTGFMMIQRSAFEKFADKYPEMMYKPDHVRTEHFDGEREIMCYFDALIDSADFDLKARLRVYMESVKKPVFKEIMKIIGVDNKKYSKRYLSEDYMFCQWSRAAGVKVWLCPWMKLGHSGNMEFAGSLQDLAALGAHPTADLSQIAKTKKRNQKK